MFVMSQSEDCSVVTTESQHYCYFSPSSLTTALALWLSHHVTCRALNIYNWIFGDILLLRNDYQPRSHTDWKTNNSREEREESNKIRKLLAESQLVSWLVVVQFSDWPDVWNGGMARQSRAEEPSQAKYL